MRKLSVLALVCLVMGTAEARAVDFKNVRATYGPFGAPRPSNKILPGDVYMLNFDITNLTLDAKTGGVKYILTLEVFDPKGKQIIPDKDKTAKKGLVVGLGGNVVPEVAHVVVGVDQPLGKYKVVITVEDGSAKGSKQLTQEVDVQATDFGLIHVLAPAVGLVGQDYVAEFAVVGMMRDAKKAPKVTITSRVLDESGKPTLAEPNVSKIPDDLPAGTDIAKQELVRMASPIFLNRAGTFTVLIEARDELSKKTAKFSYTLRVIEAK